MTEDNLMPAETPQQEVTLSKTEIFELDKAEIGQSVDVSLLGTVKDIQSDQIVISVDSLNATVEAPQEEAPEENGDDELPISPDAATLLANSLGNVKPE